VFRDESHHVDRLTNAVNRSFLGLDRAGRLWVPTDSGLFHLAAGGWRRIGPGQGLPGGWAQGLFHDREGSLWVWQAGVGLHRILGRGLWESWTRAEGLSGDIVWSIHRDRAGTLWVGTSNGLTHAAAGRWAVVAGTEGLAVRSIAEAADGTLWLGCVPAQVVHFDPRGGGVRRFGAAEGVTDAKILDVLVARSGDVWVGTRGGGLLRSRRGEEPFAGVASPRETLFVSEDSRGRIFAGGRGPGAGLAVLEGSRWRRYTTADGLLHDDLLLLREDPHGDLWVAYAEPLGISRLRLEGNVLRVLEHRTPTAGVAGTTYLLGFDGRGRLWRGTGGGIDVLAGTETRHFDSTDGLIGDDCSFQAFWLDAAGDVFIGTSRGLSRFRGGRERGAAAPPTTLVLDARLGTREVSAAGPEPVVARHHDSLRVRFSGLSFAHARRVEHQVRLLGLETDWVAAGAREVRYPALRPGRYVFEVRSRIGRQAWGPTTRLSFRILPAWWQTWPARAGEATLAGLLLAGLVRLRLRRLQRQRTHLARVVHERTVELRVANDALQRLSTSDVTTGLANRRGFDEWLEQAWRRARREGSEVTVLLLDLDCFKQYNDRYGHPGGDECLRRVGAVLAAAARRSDDLAARYGGEEFALVLPGASRLVAHAIGERIRRQVEDLAIEHAGSTVAPVVTASVGVASTTPRGDVTAAALVAAADEALYRAKAGGRNRVELLPVEPLPVAALPHRPGGKLAVGSGWPGRSAGAGRHAGGFPRPVD
jgi:diguanylate cyclase (GGDEF)-like protein